MEWYDSSYSQICITSKPKELLKLPGNWTLHLGKNVCRQFKGSLNTITDTDNENEIISFVKKDKNCQKSGNSFSLKNIYSKAILHVALIKSELFV